MILHNYTLRHPLVRGGTQQRDRLLMSLIPDQLKLDDRSIEQLIAFAGRLSTHVRHWGPDNKEDGDWLPFWESDTTSLLAILAATDLDSPRTGFRSQEIIARRLIKREESGTSKPGDQPSSAVIEDMISNTEYGIYGLALDILDICQKTPDTHPLKQDIINIVSSTLQGPLYQLIQFHKAIDPNAIKLYQGFIGVSPCSAPWGLKDNAAFECINYVLPYEHIDDLWSLFLAFYKALSLIIEKARKAFQSALRTRHDHEPHVALFLTFIYLFKHLQDDLNSMVDKHLMFYYEDVLRLERRQLIPDKVHVVFEIATKLANHLIAAGTALKAGADSNGKVMYYQMEDELVITPVKLVERRNLYVKDDVDENGNPIKMAIALPAADKKDGLAEEFPAGQKAWRALSGETVYNNLYYRYRKIDELINRYDYAPAPALAEKKKITDKLTQLQALSGFSISSTELWLESGADRVIILTFSFNSNDSSSLLDKFNVEISTEIGVLTITPNAELEQAGYSWPTQFNQVPQEFTSFIKNEAYGQIEQAEARSIPPDANFSLYSRMVRLRTKGDDSTLATKQVYAIWLHPVFPAVLPVSETEPPFIRFKEKDFTVDAHVIGDVSLMTNVAGFVPQTYDVLEYGTLGNVHQPNQQGWFYRDAEIKDKIVITGDTDADVYIRYQELFYKNPAFLQFSVNDGKNWYINTISFLSNGNWVSVTDSQNDYDYHVTLPDYTEHGGPIAASPNFPIDLKDPAASGWIHIHLSTYEGAATAYVLDANNVNFGYYTQGVNIYSGGSSDAVFSAHHYLSYFNSLGNWDDLSDNGMSATPAITMPQPRQPIGPDMFSRDKPALATANGNLYLGFEQLVPDQTLSLLFKTAPGTGNPDHFAPDIAWSYLSSNEWVELPPQYILKDTTLGMQQTGIILFEIPSDITNNNTAIKGTDGRTDLYWLRASAIEIPSDLVLVDALPMLVDIHVNAAEAVFTDNDNTEDHLEAGIPAFTISALRYRDADVKTVTQPYTSFGGRFSEDQNETGYITRIHERLRHKDRAVTVWDYERIVLEQFPQVAVIKCLPHSRRYYTARPGHVTLAAIPFPKKMVGYRCFYPILEAGDLTTIKQYLAQRNSYFVGGYGSPAFCCCEDNCECDETHDRMDVINARFEPVRIKVCVRFYKGKDIPYYTKALNEALKSFLAPWALNNKPLLFGTTINITRLLQFLERLDYVDVVTGLVVKHFASRDMADEYESVTEWMSLEEIKPYTAASVLTTYLDTLNADNPNVIDHEINVITDFNKCACGDCGGDDNTDTRVLTPAPDRGIVINPVKIVRPVDTLLGEVAITKTPAGVAATAPEIKETAKPEVKEEVAPTAKAEEAKPDPQQQLEQSLKAAWNPRAKKPETIIHAMEAVLQKGMHSHLLKGHQPEDPAKATADKNAYSITLTMKDDVVTAVNIGLAYTAGTFTHIQIDKP
jgi:hypothetical protein